ncbi:MAG: hypothetical protein ABIH26_03930 [Candidatus Eisenbacteria bacterium]
MKGPAGGAGGERNGTGGCPAPPGSRSPERELDRGNRPSAPGRREGSDELRRALQSSANVLVTGNHEAARRLFENAHPGASFRVVRADDLNRTGVEALRRAPEGGPAVLFIERLERLEPWTQVALLDLLESEAHPLEEGRIRRVISACGEGLGALVARGGFCRSLYLRLSTLHVHLPDVPAAEGADSAAPGMDPGGSPARARRAG